MKRLNYLSVSGLILAALVWASPLFAARTATLIVERDETCAHATMTDHMVSKDTLTLVLPDISGPVTASGKYQLKGNGYSLAGTSSYRGKVKDDRELTLTYGQWWYQGKAMTPAAPEMPTAASPVTLPLEPGASKTITFHNAHADQAPCSGKVTYRLKMDRETQIWDIFLQGTSHTEKRLGYWVTDDGSGKSGALDYAHGVFYSFGLAARVTLTKRKGKFEYTSGVIKKADVQYEYRQSPDLYQVKNIACNGCARIKKLAGQPLDGKLNGDILKLMWPNIRPVVTMDSWFKLKCAPGPRQASCETNKKEGTNYADEEDGFMDRAGDHDLPLTPGSFSLSVGDQDAKGAYAMDIRFDYTLVRVK